MSVTTKLEVFDHWYISVYNNRVEYNEFAMMSEYNRLIVTLVFSKNGIKNNLSIMILFLMEKKVLSGTSKYMKRILSRNSVRERLRRAKNQTDFPNTTLLYVW